METAINESNHLQIELENLRWENLKLENKRLKHELEFLKQKHGEDMDSLKQKHTEEMCEKIHLDNLRCASLREELDNLRQQHDDEMCEKIDLVNDLENAVKSFQDTERKLSEEIELCSELQKKKMAPPSIEEIKGEVVFLAKTIGAKLYKPVTTQSIFYHYMPLKGAQQYIYLSAAIINPALTSSIHSRLGLPRDMSTMQMTLAAVGLGLHVYNRPVMAGQPLNYRVLHSGYFSTLYVLGSVLGWAIIARVLPQNSIVRTIVALGASTAMLKIGYDSLDHVDKRLKGQIIFLG